MLKNIEFKLQKINGQIKKEEETGDKLELLFDNIFKHHHNATEGEV